ncbi:hypothetical protein BJ684DRAFT_17244 [Piptocephalis cylindrospora]|uniref:Pentatricopeptide repeat protein n=1 Tax=Piptocephalis cylindrospora TaxID=1907219 RepID=A0A4P9Y174_9FUNG|nr:hypothetical protein BJ684DRAFT_17244 [Piptocephalis cylindrospora]|eukprot:RKP12252.1 hypothetical protein BJ684DRAFT_17244 [Piptocephalis cylindrospora]
MIPGTRPSRSTDVTPVAQTVSSILSAAKERQKSAMERLSERGRGRGRDPPSSEMIDPDRQSQGSRSQHLILRQFYAQLSRAGPLHHLLTTFHFIRQHGLERHIPSLFLRHLLDRLLLSSNPLLTSKNTPWKGKSKKRLEKEDYLIEEINGILSILRMRGRLGTAEVQKVLRWIYLISNPSSPTIGQPHIPPSLSWLRRAPLDPISRHILLLYARPHFSAQTFAQLVETTMKDIEEFDKDSIDSHYYTLAMDAWLRAKEPKRVWEIYQKMLRAGHPLHYSSVNLLLRLLHIIGSPVRDMEVVWQGVGRQFQDPSGWSILCKACIALRDTDTLRRLVRQAAARGWEVEAHLTSAEIVEISCLSSHYGRDQGYGENDTEKMMNKESLNGGLGMRGALDSTCTIAIK